MRLALAAALALAASGASAQGVFVSPGVDAPEAGIVAPLRGIRATVAHQLRIYGIPEATVRRLSIGQVANIHSILGRDFPHGETKARVESVIRGGRLQRALGGMRG